MPTDITCKKCGSWLLAPQHRCPPLYMCRDAEKRGEWKGVHSHDADSAAERFAEKLQYQMGQREFVIEVQPAGFGEVQVFDVSFDYSVDYRVVHRNADQPLTDISGRGFPSLRLVK